MTIQVILLGMFLHYLGDYPLQGNYLAVTKGKNLYNLFVHSFIYSFTVSLVFFVSGGWSLSKFFVLLISHIIIDFVKANAKSEEHRETLHLYIDQLMHIVIMLLLMII